MNKKIFHRIPCIILMMICLMFSNGFCKGNNDDFAYVLTNSGLILREKPDVKSKGIILISYNSKVKILNKQIKDDFINGLKASWYQVIYNNKSGYVFSAFLTEFKPFNDEQILGEYIQEKTPAYPFTTTLIILPNNKFVKSINICHVIKKVFGVWKITYLKTNSKYLLHLKITDSDFGLVDEDKVELIYSIDEKKLFKLIWFLIKQNKWRYLF